MLRDSAFHAVDRRIALKPLRGELISIATQMLADADAETHYTTAVLAQAKAGVKATRLASELGWSTRRLHRFCFNNFGMPFTLLRVLYRFRAAHTLLAAGVSPAVVAARTGYADQAHLTREGSRFALTTPARIHHPTVAPEVTAGLE